MEVPARRGEDAGDVDVDLGGHGVDGRRRAALDRLADRQPDAADAHDPTDEPELGEGIKPLDEDVAAEPQRVEVASAERGPSFLGGAEGLNGGGVDEGDPRFAGVEHPLPGDDDPARMRTLRGYMRGEELRRGGP
ncbi:Uncharacterised protein [Mycobacteroides abscessus subsp. abscessus]|nr:Uncharacterised protein [Mycobacteroides abscessus subsp. abscessus]